MIKRPSVSDRPLGALVRDHGEALLRFIRAKGVSEEEAQDLAQETYLRVTRSGPGLTLVNGLSGPKELSYLLKVAQNLFFDQARQRKRRSRLQEQVAVHRELAHILGPQTPEKILAAKEDLQKVRDGLLAMPERPRTVFVLVRFEGLDLGQVATRLGVSRRTVERDMRQALKSLQDSLI